MYLLSFYFYIPPASFKNPQKRVSFSRNRVGYTDIPSYIHDIEKNKKVMKKQVVKVPFEKMPKETSMTISLDEVLNPKAGSAQEFTNFWCEKVGDKEYLKQLNEYFLGQLSK